MSDLSELVPARLASMEAQLAGILALLNGRFQVVYIGQPCVVVPPLGVVPPGFGGVHELAEATCREGITATQTGGVIKETAAPDGDPFGPGDQADAGASAYGNLKSYGAQWRSKGSCACH